MPAMAAAFMEQDATAEEAGTSAPSKLGAASGVALENSFTSRASCISVSGCL